MSHISTVSQWQFSTDLNRRRIISYPDFLMCDLSISALLHDRHDDVFGSHERQLLEDVSLDHLRIHH